MNVSATPIPVARANSRSAEAAPARATPLPASTIGLLGRADDRARPPAARATLGSGRRIRGLRRAAARRRPRSAITSSGSSMWVGPGFCAWATLNALRTTSGITRAELQPHVPLRDRLEHRDDVDVLVGLLVHPLEVALAGQRDERRAVEQRVGDAGDEVRRARAERAEADAGAVGQAAVHVGHVGAALLVADGDELDRGVLERRVEVERLLARDPEHVPDALGLEALHEQVRRLALRHDSLSRRNFRPTAVSGNLRDRSACRRPGSRSHDSEPPHPARRPRRRVCAAAPAEAAKRFTIRGAGFGHGVGMSQYGALGYAEHGWDYKQILGHYYTDTALGVLEAPRDRARAAPVDARRGVVQRRDAAGGRKLLARARPTPCAAAPAARSSCSRAAAGARSSPSPRRCAPPAPGRSRCSARPATCARRQLPRRARVPAGHARRRQRDQRGRRRRLRAAAWSPLESPPSWPAEALKAQAVAARTYALTTTKNGAGFDHYPDTRSQVYGGVAAEQATDQRGGRRDRGPAS